MKTALLVAALALTIPADPGFAPMGANPSTEVARIADLMMQLRKSVGELPSDIRRLAELERMADVDAAPVLEYFAPLQKWLVEQNAGQQCGWSGPAAPPPAPAKPAAPAKS